MKESVVAQHLASGWCCGRNSAALQTDDGQGGGADGIARVGCVGEGRAGECQAGASGVSRVVVGAGHPVGAVPFEVLAGLHADGVDVGEVIEREVDDADFFSVEGVGNRQQLGAAHQEIVGAAVRVHLDLHPLVGIRPRHCAECTGDRRATSDGDRKKAELVGIDLVAFAVLDRAGGRTLADVDLDPDRLVGQDGPGSVARDGLVVDRLGNELGPKAGAAARQQEQQQ